MVGTHQPMANRQIQQFINLSGIDQMVATHDGFVLADGRRHIVEVILFYQATTFDMVQSCLTQCLTDIRVVRRHL